MNALKSIILLGITAIFATSFLGCSRATKSEGNSSFALQIPKEGLFKAETALSDRKICYGVNITGDGIPAVKAACSPSTGIIVGFVEAGQGLAAVVPQGTNRKFELYIYLQEPGENAACPAMVSAFTPDLLSKTYLVGSLSGILLDQPDPPPFTIDVQFPGITNTVQRSVVGTGSCVAESTGGLPGFGISSDVTVSEGGGKILRGRVGRIHEKAVLTGGNIKLQVTN